MPTKTVTDEDLVAWLMSLAGNLRPEGNDRDEWLKDAYMFRESARAITHYKEAYARKIGELDAALRKLTDRRNVE